MSTRSGKTYNNLRVDIPQRRTITNNNGRVSPLSSPSVMLAQAAALANVNPMTAFLSAIVGFIVLKATGTYNAAAAIMAWFFTDQYRPLLLLSAYILVILLVSGMFHAIVRLAGKYVPSVGMFFQSNQTNSTHNSTDYTNYTNFSDFNNTNTTSYETQRHALFERLKNVSVASTMLPMVVMGAMYYVEKLTYTAL